MPDKPENTDQSQAETVAAPQPLTDEQRREVAAGVIADMGVASEEQPAPATEEADDLADEGVVELEDDDEDWPELDLGYESDEEEEASYPESEYGYDDSEESEVEDELPDDEQLSDADKALLAERRKRLTAEKRLAFAESQALAIRRKNWVERDGKHFPFLRPQDLGEIAGRETSRRAFARAARAQNEKIKQIAGPIIQRELEQQKQQRTTELKAQWGKPVAGPGAITDVQRTNRELDEARAKGDLQAAVKALMFGAKK
jgi:hypothetical protein